METQKRLTLARNIVISVGLFGPYGDDEVWDWHEWRYDVQKIRDVGPK